MCSTTAFCFNLPPSTSPSTPMIARKSSRSSCTSLVSPPSWRSRSVTAIAAVRLAQAIIGIGIGIVGNLYFSGEGLAMAEAEDIIARGVVKERVSSLPVRWSNRRACPPWQTKTFELIVPENLPRPSPRRSWESVGDFSPAAAARASARTTNDWSSKCFSL